MFEANYFSTQLESSFIVFCWKQNFQLIKLLIYMYCNISSGPKIRSKMPWLTCFVVKIFAKIKNRFPTKHSTLKSPFCAEGIIGKKANLMVEKLFTSYISMLFLC